MATFVATLPALGLATLQLMPVSSVYLRRCGRFDFETIFVLFAPWRRTGKHTISILAINEESGQGGPGSRYGDVLGVEKNADYH